MTDPSQCGAIDLMSTPPAEGPGRPPRGKNGPRSLVGRRRSSRNSLRHGLCAKDVAIAGLESEREWQRLRKAWLEDLAPIGPVEHALVERAVLCQWRLLRASRYETGEAAEQQRLVFQDRERQAQDAEFARGEATFAKGVCRALERLVSPEANDSNLALDGHDAAEALCVAAECIGLECDHYEAFPWPGLPQRIEPSEFEGWTVGLVRNSIAALTAFSQWNEAGCVASNRLPMPRLAEVAANAEPSDWPDVEALDALVSIRRDDSYEGGVVISDPAILLNMAAQEAKSRALQARMEAGRLTRHSESLPDKAPGLPSDDVLKRTADYETRAERSLFKTLHELQRLQALRQNQPVAAPIALDVCLDGGGGRGAT